MTKVQELLQILEDETEAPANAFKHAMERPVSHLIEDLGSDEYAVSTGDKYPIHVKVLGWAVPKNQS